MLPSSRRAEILLRLFFSCSTTISELLVHCCYCFFGRQRLLNFFCNQASCSWHCPSAFAFPPEQPFLFLQFFRQGSNSLFFQYFPVPPAAFPTPTAAAAPAYGAQRSDRDPGIDLGARNAFQQVAPLTLAGFEESSEIALRQRPGSRSGRKSSPVTSLPGIHP